jgi:hypothetical protein
VSIAWFVIALAAPGMAPGGPDTQLLETVRIAYMANRERFGQGTARFELIQGKAGSEEDARKGNLGQPVRASGFFAHAPGKARFDLLYPLDLMAQSASPAEGDRMLSSLTGVRCLTDGENTLLDDVSAAMDSQTRRAAQPPREQHVLRIRRGAQPFYRELEFPLRPGHPDGDLNNLAARIEQAAQGEDGWKLVSVNPDVPYEGTRVVEVVFERGDVVSTYLVDLDHGAVPRRVHNVNRKKERFTTTCYDDIQLVAENQYLPFVQTISMEDGTAKRLQVLDYKVGPPPESAFELRLAEPRPAIDQAHNIRLAARDVYRLRDLGGALGRADRRFTSTSKQPAIEPELPGERATDPFLGRTLLGIGAAVVLILAVVWYRGFARRT